MKEDGAISTMLEICRFQLFQPGFNPAVFFQQSWMPPNVAEDIRCNEVAPSLMLQSLRRRQDRWALTDGGADGAHPAAHCRQEGSACVLKETPPIRDLQRPEMGHEPIIPSTRSTSNPGGATSRPRLSVPIAAAPNDAAEDRSRQKLKECIE